MKIVRFNAIEANQNLDDDFSLGLKQICAS